VNYILRIEQSEQPLAKAKLSDNFAAERWAKDWVRQHAREERYVLERDDGGFAEILFKTNAGQWYLTPRR
jgi:hypothetical protein